MRRQDFSYDLPDELIAYKPTTERTGSRLLCLNGANGKRQHRQFAELLEELQPGDVMVFNDTKVIPARFFGQKTSGGKVEVLVERILDSNRCLAHIRSSKSPKPGAELILEKGIRIKVIDRSDNLFIIDSGLTPLLPLLESIGHMPLPPYIQRSDTLEDHTRYQTVYGRHAGAVAAPTAGLHFDDSLLKAIKDKGIEIVFTTLHVGAGTFQPVRVDNITDHKMHSEWMTLEQSTCDVINRAKNEDRRIIAVGTTSVRSLETAAIKNTNKAVPHTLMPYQGETDIFIYPVYQFNVVDALVTNFHLSESTLLMLVSAFAGYRNTLQAYNEAVEKRYRFFSYGDAMFITRNPLAPQEKLSFE